MTSTIRYEGELRTLATHLQSGSELETDAPTDNKGKGLRFSPTDLIGTALASCMLTTMAIRAEDLESKIKGTTVSTEKIMSSSPRKIGALHIHFNWPIGSSFTAEERKRLEEIAWSCPVKESLHPDMLIKVNFNWPNL